MPNNIIMADPKWPTDIITGTATVSEDRKITIPLKSDKRNFVTIPDYSDEETPSALGSIVVSHIRQDYLSDTRVYYTKVTNWGVTPPQLTASILYTSSVNETSDSITITGSNGNSTGLLIPGQKVRYFVW